MIESYSNGKAFVQAVKATLQSTGELRLQKRLQEVWFDRFLSRVFASDSENNWLLKGGVGLLSRTMGGRETRDIDLTVTAGDVESVVEELARFLQKDLGDGMRFDVSRSLPIAGMGGSAPGARAYITGFADQHVVTKFHVDIVVAPPPVGRVSTVVPAGRLSLKRPVESSLYRVFPIEDHLAEKIAAVYAHERGNENTRVKDLVDILIITRTQPVDLATVKEALDVTLLRTGTALEDHLAVPVAWRSRFPRESQGTIVEGVSFDAAADEARTLVLQMLTPASPRRTAAIPQAELVWDSSGRLISSAPEWFHPPGPQAGQNPRSGPVV